MYNHSSMCPICSTHVILHDFISFTIIKSIITVQDYSPLLICKYFHILSANDYKFFVTLRDKIMQLSFYKHSFSIKFLFFCIWRDVMSNSMSVCNQLYTQNVTERCRQNLDATFTHQNKKMYLYQHVQEQLICELWPKECYCDLLSLSSNLMLVAISTTFQFHSVYAVFLLGDVLVSLQT